MLAYARPVTEIIHARTSWRSYLPGPLGARERDALREAIAGVGTGPFGSPAHFVLVEGQALAPAELRRFGTYGQIHGASSFLAGVVRRGPHAMEDFGFAFEQLILKATELGLGTCWLGGSLRRSAVGEHLGATAAEAVPAMSPVGAVPERRGLHDRIIRWSAGSHKRRPASELFFAGDLDHPLAPCAWTEPLEMVRLAPSASNKQPWRVLHDPARGALHFLLRRTPGYAALVRGVDLQRIDLGIAMAHFALGARERGLAGGFEALPAAAVASPPALEYLVSWFYPRA